MDTSAIETWIAVSKVNVRNGNINAGKLFIVAGVTITRRSYLSLEKYQIKSFN